MNRKGFIENLADWTVAIQKRLDKGEDILKMASEIDSMEALLATADGVAVRKKTIPLDKAAFNDWAKQPAFPQPDWHSRIGREDISYRSGERVLTGANGDPAGGTRMVNGHGHEVRSFGRGESYADSIGADTSVSLGKLIRGMATGHWADADYEKRISSTIDQTAAGFLLNPELSAMIIDRARNKSSVFAAGAQFVPMTTNELYFAKLNTDPTAEWVGEYGTITATDADFGQIRLTAKNLACLTSVSIPLLEDAVNGPQVIENAVLQSIAQEWDRAALRGLGGVQPMGIANTTGINTRTGIGSPIYDDILAAMEDCEANNGEPNSWILNSRDEKTFRTSKTGDAEWQRAPEAVARLNRVISNQIPRTLGSGGDSEIYVGDFRQCIIGVRTNAKLEIFRSGGTASDDAVSGLRVYIRAYLRGDVGLAHANHFCLLSGVTA